MSTQRTVGTVAGGLMAGSASAHEKPEWRPDPPVFAHHALDRSLFGLAATAGARLSQRS